MARADAASIRRIGESNDAGHRSSEQLSMSADDGERFNMAGAMSAGRPTHVAADRARISGEIAFSQRILKMPLSMRDVIEK